MTKLSVFIDRNYLYPAIVSLISARVAFPASCVFYIGTFEKDLSHLDKEGLQNLFDSLDVELRLLEISKKSLMDEIGEIDSTQHFGYAAFGRLAMQKQIKERHIYSDVDVLFHMNPDEPIRSLVRSERIGFVRQSQAYSLANLPCSEDNEEFFSGFVHWPEIHQRPVLTFAAPQSWRTSYSTHDQALLNIKIGQNFEPLDPLFCQLDNPKLNAATYKPGILHYFGNWKPWQATGQSRVRCKSNNCSWTLWFNAEEEAEKLLRSLGLSSWFRELRKVSLRGAPKNLRLLRWVLFAGRVTGTFFAIEWAIRLLWRDERHLIH